MNRTAVVMLVVGVALGYLFLPMLVGAAGVKAAE